MKSVQLTETLYDYMLGASLRETDVQRCLREATESLPGAIMQIPPEQGQFMRLLAELMGAQRCIEVGVYTGYSALSVALALPKNGKLIACDIDPSNTEIAQHYWREAGVENIIELRLGPALETLNDLIDEGGTGRYDMAFIDADKTEYNLYYETLITLLRPRGLLIADNVLWAGRVADSSHNDPDTDALRSFAKKLHGDERGCTSLLPVADGLLLAMKREL